MKKRHTAPQHDFICKPFPDLVRLNGFKPNFTGGKDAEK
jgi:hypothetical protein